MNTCQLCGNKYEPTRTNQKYCSGGCYHKSRTGAENPNRRIQPKVVHCAWCGKEFETGGRGRPPKGQLFCSKRCMSYARVREHKVNDMTIAQAAYLAGLVDGEGSIIAVKRNSEGRHTWRLTVSNTDVPLLEWCIHATGVGSIVTHENQNPKHKTSHCWQCYSWNAYDVLRQIAPYMIIKRDLALRMMAELDEIKRIAGAA